MKSPCLMVKTTLLLNEYIYISQWLQCMILFATFTNVANICNIGLRSVWEQTFIYDSRPGLIYGFGLPAPGHHMGFVPYAWSLFLISFRYWNSNLLFLPKEGRLILALMCNLFIRFQHVSSDAVSQPAMQLERQCFRRLCWVAACSVHDIDSKLITPDGSMCRQLLEVRVPFQCRAQIILNLWISVRLSNLRVLFIVNTHILDTGSNRVECSVTILHTYLLLLQRLG